MNDYKNPSNTYLEAKFKAWISYTNAYHSDAPMYIQEQLHKAFEIASEGYANNPQTIFNHNTLDDNVDKMLDTFDSFIKNNEI